MPGETTSPNMNLTLPGVGITTGPQYATDLNASLTTIDQHNHTTGNGVAIPSAGININADLPANNNNVTNLRTVRLQPQTGTLSAVTDLGCLYEVVNDLYYNDGLGNQIRLTQSGGVAGTPGSISNLTSPASAAYVAGSQTFVWQSAANTPANLDAASVVLRNLTANSKGLTLAPPASMAANYSVTLPALPAATSLLAMDTAGNITAPYSISGGLNASVLTAQSITATQIANNTITETQMAPLSIGTPELINNSVTPAKLSAKNIVVSASCGLFSPPSSSSGPVTNLSVTITTTGRPVVVQIMNDGSGNSSTWSTASGQSNINIVRNSTTTISAQTSQISSGIGVTIPTTTQTIDGIISPLAAGTYTYTVVYGNSASNFSFFWSCLVAYEL